MPKRRLRRAVKIGYICGMNDGINTSKEMNVTDEMFMRRALQLAALGRGKVSPNPMVGAVITDAVGNIIGEGYHRRCGGPHAEVNAVNSVADKSKLKDSTIYVTLEPCSHYGKTPPCAELLIKTGIPRVVVGSLDPFPKVSGRGVRMLREAGIEVRYGVLEAECVELNRRFMTAHRHQRPFVQLKWAESADGYIDGDRTAQNTAAAKISNEVSAVYMHRERAVADAIMVGANTVVLDDPQLTVRKWYCREQPLRVILDNSCSVPGDKKVLNDGLSTLVYNQLRDGKSGNVEHKTIDTNDLGLILADLYRRGVTSLMVEGGRSVLSQFIDSGLWDEARIERGEMTIGTGVKAPKIKGKITKVEKFGGNEVKYLRNCVKSREKTA